MLLIAYCARENSPETLGTPPGVGSPTVLWSTRSPSLPRQHMGKASQHDKEASEMPPVPKREEKQLLRSRQSPG